MFKFKHPFTGEQVEMSEHRFNRFRAAYPHIHFDFTEVTEQTEETTGEQVEEKPKKSKSPKKTEIDG